MPVIAAINGHAFGDGSIMACCCDYRFMKSGRGSLFCFPEGTSAFLFCPACRPSITKPSHTIKVQEAAFSGKRYGAAELAAHHVIEKACDDEETLLKEAVAFARTYQKKRPIFGEMKKRFHKNIIAAIENEDPKYIESLKIMM